MNFYLMSALSLSIAPAAVAGFVRRKKIDDSFAPFLWLLWAGLLNEVLSFYLVLRFRQNYFNYNLFLLLEVVLLCLFFRRQGLFESRPWLFPALVGLFGGFWVAELVFAGLARFEAYSILLFSVGIALLSIYLLNRVLFRENHRPWRNASFLLCVCFIIYYLYGAAVEIFLIVELQESGFFQVFIYDVSIYLNAIINLLFFVVVLWMPLKPHLLLQPSSS